MPLIMPVGRTTDVEDLGSGRIATMFGAWRQRGFLTPSLVDARPRITYPPSPTRPQTGLVATFQSAGTEIWASP